MKNLVMLIAVALLFVGCATGNKTLTDEEVISRSDNPSETAEVLKAFSSKKEKDSERDLKSGEDFMKEPARPIGQNSALNSMFGN